MAHYEQNLWRDMQNHTTNNIFDSIKQLQGAPMAPAPRPDLGEQMGRDAGISFTPPPIVSQADQSKQKYYNILIEQGVDQSMARQIAGMGTQIKNGIDMVKGKAPFAQGDSWNVSGTPFGSNPYVKGIWNF